MNKQEAYSQYLILSLAQAYDVIDQHEDYDEAWSKGGELLVEFNNSEFDREEKSEYDCIVEFLLNKRRCL